MIIAFPHPGKEQNPAYDLLQDPFSLHHGMTTGDHWTERTMATYAIIAAAGQGLRMNLPRPKQFLPLGDRPLLAHTARTFLDTPLIDGLVLVVPPHCLESARKLIAPHLGGTKPVYWARGGKERQDSVYNGILAAPGDCRWLVVHDGARPLVSAALVKRTCLAARETGAAICGLPATDTVKRVDDGVVSATLRRDSIWLVQTPQVFARDVLLEAYRQAAARAFLGTDDASLVERTGVEVRMVEGERSNIKVTNVEDLAWAGWWLERTSQDQ